MAISGELEGTWEEILAHSSELAGQRVRVTVLPPDDHALTPDERQRMTLEVLGELKNTEWTDEEMAILDGFEEFRKQHPLTFRRLHDEP